MNICVYNTCATLKKINIQIYGKNINLTTQKIIKATKLDKRIPTKYIQHKILADIAISMQQNVTQRK